MSLAPGAVRLAGWCAYSDCAGCMQVASYELEHKTLLGSTDIRVSVKGGSHTVAVEVDGPFHYALNRWVGQRHSNNRSMVHGAGSSHVGGQGSAFISTHALAASDADQQVSSHTSAGLLMVPAAAPVPVCSLSLCAVCVMHLQPQHPYRQHCAEGQAVGVQGFLSAVAALLGAAGAEGGRAQCTAAVDGDAAGQGSSVAAARQARGSTEGQARSSRLGLPASRCWCRC